MFRLLNILRKQLEIRRLEAKTEVKYILYFTSVTYNNLNENPVDVQNPRQIMKKILKWKIRFDNV